MGELKVGDMIATNREFGKGVDLNPILSESPTMWVCRHKRFRKESLKVVGPGRWGPFQGRVATDADLMAHRIERAGANLRKIEVTAANVDAAEAFIAQVAEVGK